MKAKDGTKVHIRHLSSFKYILFFIMMSIPLTDLIVIPMRRIGFFFLLKPMNYNKTDSFFVNFAFSD